MAAGVDIVVVVVLLLADFVVVSGVAWNPNITTHILIDWTITRLF